MSTILVTGGTGTLGSLVTPLLRDAKLRVLSRTGHEPADGIEYFACDLTRGEGLEPAVDGVDVVLHLAGGPKGDDVATENLVRAARRAGVGHFAFISVIAADRVPLGYFRRKHAAEEAVIASGLPWTVLRAAQFHGFCLDAVRAVAKLPLVPVPGMRFQPVDARDVAARLADLTLGAPAGRVPDLAGPRVYEMRELVDDYLRANGKRRPKLPIRLPGKAGRAYRAGANLNLDAQTGTRTWESYLAATTATDTGN
ncbi:SDR family oxidoreductase [Amycolatopsis sp. FDAARGOS 1241]|uniref:SDR family oxidoreductase n=1 Tax=Amycolatopsis sp. FDAARGOS 1241 TaxID=2778070 RepID=UPI00194F8DEC|nr:NAD(P)H-binding protein [Amycolatopsis sp. FDAARGOS 1241]QRP46603.1 NAD(P)H-binding protein [Amycolatopsis sp. FDAARGOS 1241]